MTPEQLEKLKSIALYILGLAGIVIGALPQIDVQNWAHGALVIVGGVIVAVERYLQQNGAVAKARKLKAGA